MCFTIHRSSPHVRSWPGMVGMLSSCWSGWALHPPSFRNGSWAAGTPSTESGTRARGKYFSRHLRTLFFLRRQTPPPEAECGGSFFPLPDFVPCGEWRAESWRGTRGASFTGLHATSARNNGLPCLIQLLNFNALKVKFAFKTNQLQLAQGVPTSIHQTASTSAFAFLPSFFPFLFSRFAELST